MKKIFSIILSMVLVVAVLVGCGVTSTKLEGSLSDILVKMNENVDVGMVFQNGVSKEQINSYAGISESDFETYIDSAAVSEGMRSTAHQVLLIKAKDKESALKLQELIYEKADAKRWICAIAEKVLVGVSDEYTLLIMSSEKTTDALYDAFVELAKKVGKPLSRAGNIEKD